MTSDDTTRSRAGVRRDDAELPDTPDQGRFVSGTVLAGRYRIVGLLGKGGMGEVYRADDLKLRHPVALKFLPPNLVGDPARLARLHNEVRVARQVSHPNVCRVHDIGEVEGEHFLSMEYVDGEDLASLLSRIGRLPTDKAVEIARQICAGLAAAHERGVLHRDLKPANVMIDGRGKARLSDFGLAVAAGDSDVPGGAVGTPAYMSPEQTEGRDLSVRSDIYALGLVLYELFTGQRAFKGRSAQEIRSLHRDTPPARPSTHVPDLDPVVERVILRCLVKEPIRRPVSALAVSAALPGGDPLAAVLAAGETPPPEMVAAAGDRGALHPGAAWAFVALVALACPALLLLLGQLQGFAQALPEKPPEALAVRAREVIQSLGHDVSPNGVAHAFQYDNAYLRYSLDQDHPPAGQGRPGAIHFRYRQIGDDRLAAYRHPALFQLGFRRAIPLEASPLVPGLVDLRLDTRGHLVEFHAERQLIEEPEEVADVDWTTLFEEMGLDIEAFEPAAPRLAAVVPADARAAWQGSYPETPGVAIRIEAASYRGRVVSSRVVGPWNPEGRPPVNVTVLNIFRVGIAPGSIIALGCGLLLAGRNLRLKRGDRHGALRLASVIFAASALASVFQAHRLSLDAEALHSLATSLGWALWNAALIWVLYMAIEPIARRRWPDVLISWSRLLAGRFRDPRVGRDVLIGVACTWLYVVYLAMLGLGGWFGSPQDQWPVDLGHLSGPQYFFARLLAGVTHAVFVGLICLVPFALVRLVARWRSGAASTRVAAALTIFLIALATAAGSGEENFLPVLTTAVLAAGALLVIMRVGVLAFVVMEFLVGSVGIELPATLDLSAWYGQPTVLFLGTIAAVTVYGFFTALGGQPMLGEGSLEE